MTSGSAGQRDEVVDLLVVGSGTGMAAALAASELGLSSLVIEKTPYVGGSTARSGGGFWVPANPILKEEGSADTLSRARTYLQAVVRDTAPAERIESFLENSTPTIEMLRRTTSMRFMWSKDYSDYHPELPGGTPAGASCECRPYDLKKLGNERKRLRPGIMEAPVPMPATGSDYRWMNLMARVPRRAWPRILLRAAQGIGGLIAGREFAASGQALAAGMFEGLIRAGVPVWTDTSLVRLVTEDGRVTGAVVNRAGSEVSVTARHGVVLAAGGFDHDMEWRRKFQSESLDDHASLGCDGNTGDAIRSAQDIGADVDLMDQAWWFPAIAPLPGGAPVVMLAERSLPGSLIVNDTGRRFVNESTDYMSFGQRVLELGRTGAPVGDMWLIFDQKYRNSYLLGAELFPRMAIPKSWYEAGIAHRAENFASLADQIGIPTETLLGTVAHFNDSARIGDDPEFHRGASAYDRYYGDPTITPNPNLRPLTNGPFYAVKVVLSDLGTCGGLRADSDARVLREDGTPLEGLYAIGNTAANVFGDRYPGAGATIGQGMVFGYIAAHHAAGRRPVPVSSGVLTDKS